MAAADRDPERHSLVPPSSEDYRGVDIAQIRRNLRLSPGERLDQMTNAVNRMRELQRSAHPDA
ncbi:MAG TPA: hypothetical protein VGP37_08880 [Candidatus Nanopelagicales bacterium]|nr:hypothetical protein [Candidatus Nanopelagicales bacterium]